MTQVDFQARVGSVERQHKAMANGYKTEIREDGLIVVKPKRVRRGFPLRGITVLLFSLFLFKGYTLAVLGAPTYADRVAKLADGTVMEQASAWVMQADPITMSLAELIAPLI